MKIQGTTLKKLAIVAVVAALFALFFKMGWHEQLTFENLKARQDELRASVAANQTLWIVGFAVAYIVMAAAQLPGAALMTIAGGVLFGLLVGTIVVSFASTIGATLAMLVSRYLFRDSIEKRYGHKLRAFNEGIAKDGGFYLFTLRLIPVVPFFLINLGAGLTAMRPWTFYWVSQVGMLAGTAVYVNAGTQIGQLESLSGLLSPRLWGAFVLLALFPFIARKILGFVKARRVFRQYEKPKVFDYNVVVIGAGSGGLVASLIAAAVKAKVALVEKHQMGGDCLNTGCVPSKALIRSAKMAHYAKRAEDWGFRSASVDFDFSDVMDRVHRVIKEIEPHDSVERFTGLGVDCVEGEATIESPWRVRVTPKGDKRNMGDRVLTARNIVVATGASPLVPPIPGLDEVDPLTSENLWQLRELPERLVVLGGGPIGSEMTQAFARLGSQVTQVEMLPRILPLEDPEISEMVADRFRQEGIRVLTGHKATRFGADGGQRYMMAETMLAEDHGGNEVRIDFDRVIMALGRRARVTGFGLEELGVEIAKDGTIQSDEFLRTNYPNIYVCGDVAGPYQFTHVAAHQAWYASVNALFSPFKDFKADYRVIPWTTFTDPEVAHLGLNELEAKEQEIPYEVSTYGIDDLDRAITDGENYGVVKVLTQPGKDKILGATIVGPHAGDLMAEYVLAMKHGLGLNKILGTIHTYPTLAEANKYAAGVWKKAHAPEKLLARVEKFHAWRRGQPLSAGTRAAAAAAALLAALAVGGVALSTQEATEMPPPAHPPPADVSADAAFAKVLARVDDQGMVDYAGLKADPSDLEAYYAAVANQDPAEYESWGEDWQIAFWSNAYNALTLKAIVENYPIKRSISVGSIAFPRGIRWIPGVWDKLAFTVMGREITLNDIEHQVLRVEYDEPRIHAALVCAARSCPTLRNEPYTAERLDEQLDDQTRRFLARPDAFRIDRGAGKVYVSKILEWYGGDFIESFEPEEGFEGLAEAERAVIHFISGYLGEADREYLEAGGYDVEYLSYDWSLNEQS